MCCVALQELWEDFCHHIGPHSIVFTERKEALCFDFGVPADADNETVYDIMLAKNPFEATGSYVAFLVGISGSPGWSINQVGRSFMQPKQAKIHAYIHTYIHTYILYCVHY